MLAEDLRQSAGKIGYRTIVEAVSLAVSRGKLLPGQRLPPQRDLAQDIGVAVATVGRAYAELEARGILTSHVGRGTFVSAGPRRALPATAEEGPVDLATYRAPVPREGDALARLMRAMAGDRALPDILAEAPTGGLPRHREAIAAWMGRCGLAIDPGAVVITNGGQHAVMAALAAIAAPGAIATEELTDPRMKAVAHFLRRPLTGLACDAEGPLPDHLDHLCRRERVAALYCTPRNQNPTNVTLPLARREALVAVARRHDLPIIESGIYATLTADPLPALTALAPERTFHLSSFGRIAGAGIKVGWLVAPPGTLERARIGLAMTTGAASPFMVEMATRWVRDGQMEEMAAWQRAENERRLAMVAARPRLSAARGHATSAHVWLDLPEPWRAEDFVEAAAAQDVAIAPSHSFVVGRRLVPHSVRLVIGAPASRDLLARACDRLEALLAAPPPLGRTSG